MKLSPHPRRTLIIVSALLIVAAMMGGTITWISDIGGFGAERKALRAQIAGSTTEDELVSRMGKPHRVQTRSDDHETCRVNGYAFLSRTISHRCLIYFGKLDSVAYVYVDKEGRVEDVYVGGS